MSSNIRVRFLFKSSNYCISYTSLAQEYSQFMVAEPGPGPILSRLNSYGSIENIYAIIYDILQLISHNFNFEK